MFQENAEKQISVEEDTPPGNDGYNSCDCADVYKSQLITFNFANVLTSSSSSSHCTITELIYI